MTYDSNGIINTWSFFDEFGSMRSQRISRNVVPVPECRSHQTQLLYKYHNKLTFILSLGRPQFIYIQLRIR